MQAINENGYLAQARTKTLCEKWSKRIALVENTTLSGKSMDLARKATLARVLENTQQFIKYQISEGVQSSDVGQYKRYALDIITTVVPNLIAYDLVSVQPIENRIGMVNYIKYIYNSTKGSTTAGTEFASSLNMSKSDVNYTSRKVDVEGVTVERADSNQTLTGTLAWKPVIPGTVSITLGSIVISDDGAGNLTATTGLSDGSTIDYSTGAITIKLSAADTTNSPVVSYEYNNEYIPANDIPEIGLKLESAPIQAQARRLKAFYAFEASYELQKEYGQDMQEILNTQAAAEIAHEIDEEIISDLYKNASAGNEIVWSKTQPTGVNLIDHYDSFVVKLEEGSAAIYQATRRVRANFVVCGTSVGVVAQSCRNFVASGNTNVTGPYFAGTLNNFKVYVDPELDPNTFVMGYKGDNLLNAGYVYAPYMPVMTTDLVQLEDMAGRKGWCTMYGKLMLNSKLYLRGRITA